ncbi:hypothetical protein [Iodobacter fluviatilis]|uniref:Secreted protein with PEP-CTERM sorting signal n=1 Tax=Iodobacter fluviatilis TaxID=537 RepID=A0A377QBG1_9NEIS|nr:hypothetical protein [Iodobacter fluviatilis]TCU88728.1 putative secreted protein with PEP-CTERM sorting signal [Iodobacter fluviatilis]STQ91201.1 Uncharacterised protein [Iodobacter fluviatilis]
MFANLKKRFKEPSSWAGLSSVIGAALLAVPSNNAKAIGLGLQSLAGVLAFVLPEKGGGHE